VFDKNYPQHLNRANAFDPTQVQVNEPGRSAWLKVKATF
jgi:iron complex outermembrane receptor protein